MLVTADGLKPSSAVPATERISWKMRWFRKDVFFRRRKAKIWKGNMHSGIPRCVYSSLSPALLVPTEFLLSDHTPYSLELPSFILSSHKIDPHQFPCYFAFCTCLTGLARCYLLPHVSMLSSSLTGSIYPTLWPLLSAAALSGSHHRSTPRSHSLESGCVILSYRQVSTGSIHSRMETLGSDQDTCF